MNKISQMQNLKYFLKELSILGDITKSMKVIKNEKSNDIQLQIMNLENGGIPVNRFLGFTAMN